MPKPMVVKTFRFPERDWDEVERIARSVNIDPSTLVRFILKKVIRDSATGALKEDIERLQRAQEALFG